MTRQPLAYAAAVMTCQPLAYAAAVMTRQPLAYAAAVMTRQPLACAATVTVSLRPCSVRAAMPAQPGKNEDCITHTD